MEIFIRHIENLLIKNDFVIIPDFGGFVVQQQSARITAGKILPPLSVIGFNPLMRNQDGLLAMEIVRTEHIAYREAVAHIKAETEKIKQQLQQKGQLEFGRLGTLKTDEYNNFIFEPASEYNFLPVNFGLKPLHTLQFNKPEKKAKTVTFTLPRSQVFRYAAVILILLGLFVMVPPLSDSSVADYASLLPYTPATEQRTSSLQQEETQPTPKAATIVENNESANQPKETFKKEYHIVVGCLADLAAAEHFCNQLKRKNYNNAVVLPSIKTNRIVIESFIDREAAVVYMRNLRLTNKEFKNAWLLQQ